jgi:hypothetical protein
MVLMSECAKYVQSWVGKENDTNYLYLLSMRWKYTKWE